MGRPKVGEPVLVRLPAELITSIDERATALGITRPELIRRVLAADACEIDRLQAEFAAERQARYEWSRRAIESEAAMFNMNRRGHAAR